MSAANPVANGSSSVVIDMPTAATKVVVAKSSGRFFSWIKDGFSLNQRIAITPLLVLGVSAMVAGTAVDVVMHSTFIGTCLKTAGVVCMVIAAYTQNTQTSKEQEAAPPTTWKRRIDRVLIFLGLAATIASMVLAIFISSSWLLFCNALTGIALIRMQSFALKMDPVTEFTKQNKILEKQVTNLESQIGDLKSLTETQKTQLDTLTTENGNFETNNKNLEERISTLDQSIKDLDEKSKLAQENNSALKTLVTHYDDTKDKIKEEEVKLRVLQEQYRTTLAKYEEVSITLEGHTKTYGENNQQLSASIHDLNAAISSVKPSSTTKNNDLTNTTPSSINNSKRTENEEISIIN